MPFVAGGPYYPRLVEVFDADNKENADPKLPPRPRYRTALMQKERFKVMAEAKSKKRAALVEYVANNEGICDRTRSGSCSEVTPAKLAIPERFGTLLSKLERPLVTIMRTWMQTCLSDGGRITCHLL